MYLRKPNLALYAVMFGVAALLWVNGCGAPAIPTAETPSSMAAAIPSDQFLPLPTPLPVPNADDLCTLYRDGGTLRLKRGENPPKEVIQVTYEQRYSSLCPPESLLPEVEYRNYETLEEGMRHLIPFYCFQHPNGHEVWFNTQQPMGYGAQYNSDLWRYFPDGNRVEQILSDGQGGQFFQFSPDGQYVILSTANDIKLMRPDGSQLQQLFEFPGVSLCSEANTWVEPMWLSDSSGVLVHIPEGCEHSPDTWPFGLWWVPIDGEAVSVDVFSQARGGMLITSPVKRNIDEERYVYWDAGMLYLGQTGLEERVLVPLHALEDGYTVFLCPETLAEDSQSSNQ